MDLFIEHLSSRVLLTMIPLEIIQGSRPVPVRVSQGHGRDSSRVSYKPNRDPTGWLPGTVRGPGTLRAFFQNLSLCPLRIPAGVPPSPCRAVYGLDPWFISPRHPSYFQVRIKSNPGSTRGEKNGRHPVGVPPGPERDSQKNGQKQPGNCPGRPLLWIVTIDINCDKAVRLENAALNVWQVRC